MVRVFLIKPGGWPIATIKTGLYVLKFRVQINSTRVEFVEPLQFLRACALHGRRCGLVLPLLGHDRRLGSRLGVETVRAARCFSTGSGCRGRCAPTEGKDRARPPPRSRG